MLVILPVVSADGNELVLKIDYSQRGRKAEVVVPPGVGKVTLQYLAKNKKWKTFTARKAVPGKVSFALPAARANRWRVVAEPTRKFPAKFYRGKNQFAGVKAPAGDFRYAPSVSNPLVNDTLASAPQADGGVTPKVDGKSEVQESDIWKIDGSTVYYFNQLRGLQVLDLTNPADPRLTASLRLPAVGQDLYLLPGTGGTRELLLLTSLRSRDGVDTTRIHLVSLTGGAARITHTSDVVGTLADSRLVGNRLVLATTRYRQDGEDRNWVVESRISDWLIAPGLAPQLGAESIVSGGSPKIAAGSDWLAVATHGDESGPWTGFSQVTVFALGERGIVRLTREPVRTAGVIADKFKFQWSGNVLTTISEWNGQGTAWSPTTVLETFRVWGPDVILPAVVRDVEHPRMARLELAKGESLFATRFSGKLAYIVTFLETDPLWVVDLADPAAPVVAGHLEVPGWSTHLEPVGDLLFSIGWESGQVAASLFDVANPANPTLVRRISLGSQSEAVWDEKALKILPQAGLAMVPMTTYAADGGQGVAGIRILDLDLEARDLRLRGLIPHAFDARRAGVVGDVVVSVSQRGLVTADISDRDLPAVLAEVALAWPVERVLDAGNFLIHIEKGNDFGGSRATARITPANAPEQVLAEIDLGGGSVRGVELRGGRLVVLRETGSVGYFRPYGVMAEDAGRQLLLDVYDASLLPSLKKLGSCVKPLEGNQVISGDGILWPTQDLACVLLVEGGWPWMPSIPWTGLPLSPMPMSVPMVDALPMPMLRGWPIYRSDAAPELLTIDLSLPDAPSVGQAIALGTASTTLTGANVAKDGLLVVGTSDVSDFDFGRFAETRFHARVVSFSPAGLPQPRLAIDLPGSLFGVTELNRDGFLAFTRSGFSATETIAVSACDGYDAYLIAQTTVSNNGPAAVSGRQLFVGGRAGVTNYRLRESGALVADKALRVGWAPSTLRCVDGVLLASDWSRLFAADVSGVAGMEWQFPGWSLRADSIAVARDGDLLVAFGDYGAERLER